MSTVIEKIGVLEVKLHTGATTRVLLPDPDQWVCVCAMVIGSHYNFLDYHKLPGHPGGSRQSGKKPAVSMSAGFRIFVF